VRIKVELNNNKRNLLQAEQPKPKKPKIPPIPAFLVAQRGARIPKNRPISNASTLRIGYSHTFSSVIRMKYGLLQSADIVSHQQKRRRSNYQGTQLFSHADLL
jgi:hypothetical protein